MIPPPQAVARNLLKNVVMAIGFKQTPTWEAMLADLELQITAMITARDAAISQAVWEAAARLATNNVEKIVDCDEDIGWNLACDSLAAALRAQSPDALD